MEAIFAGIAEYIYIPIIILIIITGILYTIKLHGLQFRKSGKALKLMVSKSKGNGEISTFGALCVSLSATIGTGNIIGVASALIIGSKASVDGGGGPGALFWMAIISLFGLATKYSEGYLAIKFRKVMDNGEVIGGPFAYIEYGMGKKFKPLAKTFALFGAIACAIGIGTMTQSNGITSAFTNIIKTDTVFTFLGNDITTIQLIMGILVTFFAALVLIGGIKSITKVCEYVVPFMAVLYILICILIICINITSVPNALKEIIVMAFNPASIIGGTAGYTISRAITSGVQKGIFANEAGLGSTPIALAESQNDDPVKEGLISMGGMIVTIVICIFTGLIIVLTGAYKQGLSGLAISNYAFQVGLPFPPIISSILLLLCITFFAFTTIIGWHLYGQKCLAYLTNNNKIMEKVYLFIFLIAVLIGSFLKVNIIWNLADIFNALMAIPNLIALICLHKVVSKETIDVVYVKDEKINDENQESDSKE